MVYIASQEPNSTTKILDKLNDTEKEVCNLPLVFAEMLKDEINAVDEHELYSGIKDLLNKYSKDQGLMALIHEYTRVLTGGTSLQEILEITIDEAVSPTLASRLTVDDTCKVDATKRGNIH